MADLLPFKLALIYNRVESIGFLILIALLVSQIPRMPFYLPWSECHLITLLTYTI